MAWRTANPPQETNDAPNDSNNTSVDNDTKKQSRIERKRSREKQRCLDTNLQFTSLAEIVREIETVDLVEEARYNLSKQYGSVGVVGGLSTDGNPSIYPVSPLTTMQ